MSMMYEAGWRVLVIALGVGILVTQLWVLHLCATLLEELRLHCQCPPPFPQQGAATGKIDLGRAVPKGP